MPSEYTLPIHGDNLRSARNEKVWSRGKLASETDIAIATIKRYESSSAARPVRAKIDYIAVLCLKLGVEQSLLVLNDNCGREIEEVAYRSCVGAWSVEGRDLSVPGHFEYPNGLKDFTALLNLHQSGAEVWGRGLDDDGDYLYIDMEFDRGSAVLTGTYAVKNDRMTAAGVAVIKYLGCGTRMEGHYLGQDVGQGGDRILGTITATLVNEI